MSEAPTGYFALVLHTHLPYHLGHSTWPHGTDTLYEAAAACYIPTLEVLERLAAEGKPAALTIGITPIVAEQLADPRFAPGFVAYLDMKCRYAQENAAGFREHGEGHLEHLAQRWYEHFSRLKQRFVSDYGSDLPAAFRRLAEQGRLEIATSCATHGYLPMLSTEASIRTQIGLGVESCERRFGVRPRGIWLPECAYRPAGAWHVPEGIDGTGIPPDPGRKGVEYYVAEAGLEWFIVDTHLLEGAPAAIPVYVDRVRRKPRIFRMDMEPRPEGKSPYRPYFVAGETPDAQGVAAFVRDPNTGLQVWSSEHGYPGDGWYLEFHKKHWPGGHKYWRITGPDCDLADKWQYEPDQVRDRLTSQADHFVALLRETLGKQTGLTAPPVLCAPFDTELFGHWWFEGPEFLYEVFSRLNGDSTVRPITLSAYLDLHPPTQAVALPEGSWGAGGGHWIWWNDWVNWIWNRVYNAEHDMQSLAQAYAQRDDPRLQQMLAQLVRTLLLLQSSDWQFLITTDSARDYAGDRAHGHTYDFERLAAITRRYADTGEVSGDDQAFVDYLYERDTAFPTVTAERFAAGG